MPGEDKIEIELSRTWIRWLPISIIVFGLAFCAWMTIQIVTTAKIYRRMDKIEEDLMGIENTRRGSATTERSER